MKIFDHPFKNVYVVNGLARSGNHLLLSWIISQISTGTVYYLNNVKPFRTRILPCDGAPCPPISLANSIIDRTKAARKFIDPRIANRIATGPQYSRWLHEGRIEHDATLIVSMEDRAASIHDRVADQFCNAGRIYKVVVMRDILNLLTSRIEFSVPCARQIL